MKRHLTLWMFILLGAVSGYGSQSHTAYQTQFTVPRATKKARARMETKFASNSKGPAAAAHHPQAQSKVSTKRRASVANTTTASSVNLGFVSATQIPAGGEASNTGHMGDFNGDGKKDVLSIVENYVNSSYVYSISAVLGNGDGTFKPAILTTITSNDPLMVADVNGDGKDDILQVHPGNAPATVDVWLSNGDGTFKQGNSYQISPATLVGGLMTDVNGDGKIDIMAVDSQTPGLVQTLLGNGDGTFQNATTITLPTTAPTDLVFADFNGDGKPDFAGVGANNQIVVYLQEGGNFVLTGTPLVTPDTNYGFCSISAGDLTGDGKAEIVTTNCDDADENTITIYVNNGDGTFATGVYYADANSAGTNPADVYAEAATIADVNGDGKADIVLTNYYGSDITILLGNGDGTVNVPNNGYATGGYPWTQALVADFNGDGLPDIMQIDDEYSYAYLKGYGDGTFRAALDYYGPINDSSWPESVTIATGDFNGDGNLDFVVGNWSDGGSTGITVYLSRGDGSLMPGVNYGSGYLEEVVVADFNGDGKLDIAATSWENASVQIFQGNGDGTFTVGSTYSTGGEEGSCPWGMVTGDFNHDGHPDLAVVNEACWEEESNTVGVLLNDGTGAFLSAVTYPLSNYGWQIATGDINGDGYTDLLVPLWNSNAVAVLLANNDNSGTFQSEYDVTLVNGPATYYGPEAVTVADFNGDGKLDFAVGIDSWDGNSQGIAVALGNGDGTFQTPNLYSTTKQNYWDLEWPYPGFVQAGDINGDGIPDLVYTNTSYSTVGVLLGNGDGTFGTPTEYPAGGDAYGLALADVNSDGALDVVTANDDSLAVTVLLNANGSAEQPNYTVSANTMTNTVAAGSPATYNLTLTSKNGYTGTVTFSCSGLPSKAKCSFNPASVVATGSTPQSTVLTITTTATTTSSLIQPARPNSNSGFPMYLASLNGLGLFGLVLAAGTKKRNRRNLLAVVGILVLVMCFTLVGCGGNSAPATTTTTPPTTTVAGTPAGTYTVTVTSTGTGANAPTHSMNFTLVVQ